MERTTQNSYFETASIGSLIAKFSIPCIISLVVNALYNIVDQIFIGRGIGYLGNGATSVVFPITVIATAFALLIGDGGAAYLSLKLGEKNQADAEKGVGNSITMLFVSGLFLIVFVLALLPQLLFLTGTTDAIMPYAIAYGGIIAIGLPFVVISTGLNSIIRADGNPRLAMISMLLGAATNTVLDPVFIFVFHWGVKGAALATVLGQIISFLVSFVYIRKLRSIKLTRNCFRLNIRTAFSCLSLGISSFITQIAIVIVSSLCNNLLYQYGEVSKYGADIPITVIGIVMKVNQILVALLIGVSTGAQPILGYNYGANNMKRVKKTYSIILIANFVISALACVLFQCSPQSIVNIFGSESDLYNEFAIKAFRIFLMMCIPTAFQITSSIFLQAIGKPLPSMVSALLRQLIIFVPAALILAQFLGLDGILWAAPISDLTSAAITLFMIAYAMQQINRGSNRSGKGLIFYKKFWCRKLPFCKEKSTH